MDRPRFHLAFPVSDLEEARAFYGGVLGCPEGRSSDDWVDFDLMGHQIVAHLAPEACGGTATNAVDGEAVPVRHFGLILEPADWEALAERLDGDGHVMDVGVDEPRPVDHHADVPRPADEISARQRLAGNLTALRQL